MTTSTTRKKAYRLFNKHTRGKIFNPYTPTSFLSVFLDKMISNKKMGNDAAWLIRNAAWKAGFDPHSTPIDEEVRVRISRNLR